MQHNALEEPSSLYDRDFALWLEAQAAAVRQGRWSDIDAAHVAEELDALGNSDRHQIASRLRVLIAHLLKRDAQPERRSGSWEATIIEQSSQISDIVESSPSLRRELLPAIRKQYGRARKIAAAETKLPIDAFPLEPTAAFEERVLAAIAD